MRNGISLLAVLILGGCVAGDGCTTYGTQRASMPPLGMSPIDAWVATTDSAMTAACKG